MRNITALIIVSAISLSAAMADDDTYPVFSWDTVPVYIHVGKFSGPLTDEEISLIARTSDFVCLEKGHGIGTLGSTERGIAHDARRLKAANPRMKVLFYWNTFLNYPLYDACGEVRRNPDWLFRDSRGELIYKTGTLQQYNLLDAEFRAWWASVAGDAVKKYGCDGIFMDAVDQAKRTLWMTRGWGVGNEPKLTAAVIDMMRRAKTAMGDDALVIYNGARTNDATGRTTGLEYLPHADGATIEHFTAFRSQTPESVARDIAAIASAGRQGKIVIVKGWPDPDFTWLNSEKMRKPLDKLAEEARAKLAFSLACFLVAAEKNCYFCYSWGYRENHGSLVEYPDFHKRLGPPLGDAEKIGMVYTRQFKHTTVRVDVRLREASIQWR